MNSSAHQKISVPAGVTGCLCVTDDTSDTVDMGLSVYGGLVVQTNDKKKSYLLGIKGGSSIGLAGYCNSGTVYWFK